MGFGEFSAFQDFEILGGGSCLQEKSVKSLEFCGLQTDGTHHLHVTRLHMT